jgi:hypothetical protein
MSLIKDVMKFLSIPGLVPSDAIIYAKSKGSELHVQIGCCVGVENHKYDCVNWITGLVHNTCLRCFQSFTGVFHPSTLTERSIATYLCIDCARTYGLITCQLCSIVVPLEDYDLHLKSDYGVFKNIGDKDVSAFVTRQWDALYKIWMIRAEDNVELSRMIEEIRKRGEKKNEPAQGEEEAKDDHEYAKRLFQEEQEEQDALYARQISQSFTYTPDIEAQVSKFQTYSQDKLRDTVAVTKKVLKLKMKLARIAEQYEKRETTSKDSKETTDNPYYVKYGSSLDSFLLSSEVIHRSDAKCSFVKFNPRYAKYCYINRAPAEHLTPEFCKPVFLRHGLKVAIVESTGKIDFILGITLNRG